MEGESGGQSRGGPGHSQVGMTWASEVTVGWRGEMAVLDKGDRNGQRTKHEGERKSVNPHPHSHPTGSHEESEPKALKKNQFKTSTLPKRRASWPAC